MARCAIAISLGYFDNPGALFGDHPRAARPGHRRSTPRSATTAARKVVINGQEETGWSC